MHNGKAKRLICANYIIKKDDWQYREFFHTEENESTEGTEELIKNGSRAYSLKCTGIYDTMVSKVFGGVKNG